VIAPAHGLVSRARGAVDGNAAPPATPVTT